MNPSTALGAVLVDELVRGGVRHVVLCPGSRSAPLAFALHAADLAGRLTLHVRMDERGAGFLALGLAKGSGPVAVVTTSGTAVANLHPALLEASHGAVPVIAVTADRPPELRGTGANQTTDQVGIFGRAVRGSYDLGTPDERPGQVATWRSIVCRALSAATGARGSAPGPVHLNVPLREPLVPDDDTAPGAHAGRLEGRPDGLPWVQVAPSSPTSHAPDLGPRTLVLVGDLPGALRSDVPAWGTLAARLAAANGWPLVAEPTGGGARAAGVPAGSLLLTCTDWVDRHRPEQVLVVGRVTLARSAAALLRHPGTAVELVSDDQVWPDPAHRVRRVHPLSSLLPADPVGAVDATGDCAGGAAGDHGWAGAWRSAGERVAAAADELLHASWPSGAAVAGAVTAALPEGAVLFAGSSNAVRDLDLSSGAGGPLVLANRGLAGIDGCLSTAAGVALSSGRPTYALVGDLTFVHDLTALVVGPGEPRPDLTVVVVNDDGGGIFTLLEPGAPQHAEVFERVFGTPHGTDLGQVCAATSTAYVPVATPTELVAALQRPPQGTTVVEVRLQRSGHRGAGERLRAVAAAAAG